MSDAQSFLGSIVLSKSERAWPFDHLLIEADQLRLKSPFRDHRVLDRSEVVSIEIERVRVPLLWRTVIWFRLRSDYVGFVAYRTRRVTAVLQEFGWSLQTTKPSP